MCLTRLLEGVNSTIPRNALRKNASGVAMRMKIRQSKTPQLRRKLVTGYTVRRYEQLETCPEMIEQELRPAVCER